MLFRGFLSAILLSMFATSVFPSSAFADITCYDFSSQADAQAVLDALPNDPFGLDTGWPINKGLTVMGDVEPGNGVACDSENSIPDNEFPGGEPYVIGADPSQNGRTELPTGLEEVTIAASSDIINIRVFEDSSIS